MDPLIKNRSTQYAICLLSYLLPVFDYSAVQLVIYSLTVCLFIEFIYITCVTCLDVIDVIDYVSDVTAVACALKKYRWIVSTMLCNFWGFLCLSFTICS